MPFDFVRFDDAATSFNAKVTIRSTGQLGFSTGAVNKYQLNTYKYGVLYFDTEQRVVGIELTNDESAAAVEFHHSDGNTYLRGKNFLDYNDIPYGRAQRCLLCRDADTGFLVFSPPNENTDPADEGAPRAGSDAAASDVGPT